MANALIPIPSAVPATATLTLRAAQDYAGSPVGVFPAIDGSGGTVTSWAPASVKYAPTGSYLLTATLADGSTTTYIVQLPAAVGTTAGANNGTAPPVPVTAATATDTRGSVTFGSGTTPAAGAQALVAFAVTLPTGVPGAISIMPRNAATQALGLFVSAISATGFTVSSTAAPTASQAATVYAFDYVVTR